MKRSVKTSVVLGISLIFIFLCGFEFLQEVELSYKKPLIDLYGNSSPENPFFIDKETNDEKNREPALENSRVNNTAAVRPTQEKHIIGIKYKTITWDGSETDLQGVETKLKIYGKKGTEIILYDNFAEYQCYLSALNSIRELQEKQGFSLTERALEGKE